MERNGPRVFMANRAAFDNADATPLHLRPTLLVAVWTAPALLSCLQRWASSALDGHALSFWRIAAAEWPGWYLWAALTPLIFGVVRRFPFKAPHRVRDVVAHAISWSICLLLHATVTSTVALVLNTSPLGISFTRYVGLAAISWLPSTFLLYVSTVGVALWMRSVQRERERNRESAALSVALARAELNALRSQLHPHFLFNTLNTIAILIRERDIEVSARLVTQLGDVLRYVLLGSRSNETTLADEVTLVRTYLEIEQVRFGSRLQVRWIVPDNLLSAVVPALVLQPLVENALRHGIAHRTERGVVEIGARRDSSALVLWITDNGPGTPTDSLMKSHSRASAPRSAQAVGGVGIVNTRERLARLYPDHSSLLLLSNEDGGMCAEVRLPYCAGAA